MNKRIAFAGYAGVGKDEAAKPLIARGYKRCCFGDIIKKQIDPVVRQHLGFSAFTEDREQKKSIRRTLESWGEDNYDGIMREFFGNLPELAVNTRLVRTREAEEWRRQGGTIVLICRPGVAAATRWEEERLQELDACGFIDQVICNDGTAADLHLKMVLFAYHEELAAA